MRAAGVIHRLQVVFELTTHALHAPKLFEQVKHLQYSEKERESILPVMTYLVLGRVPVEYLAVPVIHS